MFYVRINLNCKLNQNFRYKIIRNTAYDIVKVFKSTCAVANQVPYHKHPETWITMKREKLSYNFWLSAIFNKLINPFYLTPLSFLLKKN